MDVLTTLTINAASQTIKSVLKAGLAGFEPIQVFR